jgi:hypothetical protein
VIKLIFRLVKTVAGAICIAATIALSALILQDLSAPVPASISYFHVATAALIGGGIVGLVLFVMDRRK